MTTRTTEALIERDEFPFEFISQVAERESWRKEIHRPVYHVHKWWAKRLGSIFRGVLLGASLDGADEFQEEFYRDHDFSGRAVLDPFMGSGTTLGEAHKLGFTALGRDINPVAAEAVRVALGPADRQALDAAYRQLDATVGVRIRHLYQGRDSGGRMCDVLYHFWVMQVACPHCSEDVDLFPSFVFAANAYPKRKPQVHIVCPECGSVFEGLHGRTAATCPECQTEFNPTRGTARGQRAQCPHCTGTFAVLDVVGSSRRPAFRMFAKLVLRDDGTKQYLRTSAQDVSDYADASELLTAELASGAILLPTLRLSTGYNTVQAMRYGFLEWRQFFNDRQLLALGWLRAAVADTDPSVRPVLLTLFSGLLEFNNMFASYKGEGTGAVRHMFSHHILKPERVPIEANVWGTPKSSGSFSGLYRGRLQRALTYRERPTEVRGGHGGQGVVAARPFSGRVLDWPSNGAFEPRGIYVSCGDSASLGLPDGSVDLVVTDPPFFDNVHYSELADFFYSWQQIDAGRPPSSTRADGEVQDVSADAFASKLAKVFAECGRVLKDEGLLVFTYHHSREEGWHALARAVLEGGFVVVNSQPVKSEMAVAMPVAAAKDPISFDIVVVCRKVNGPAATERDPATAIAAARSQLRRLADAGFALTTGDIRTVEFGQLLTTVRSHSDIARLRDQPARALAAAERAADKATAVA